MQIVKVIGAVTEHWMDKRIRQHKAINLEGNVPRMSSLTLLNLHNYKNQLEGSNRSLFEANEIAKESVYVES